MKTQISTTVSRRTRQQANELGKKLGYSLRDIITVAIDRMHKEEMDQTVEEALDRDL